MRVALIGPVPPDLGGATPGGVATHQVHLAAGLVAAGVDASLLATNAYGSADTWGPRPRRAHVPRYRPFPMYQMVRSVDALEWLFTTDVRRLVDYVVAVGRRRSGSRREILANLLWYRRFLRAVRPQLIHVQHPLERCLYARMVRRIERWRVPLVVTAHSLFDEHPQETIYSLMAPNLRAADRVIAVNDHVAAQAIQLGVKPDTIAVVRSGVDTEQFQPRDRTSARLRLGLPETAPIVLFIGNLEPRKQVDILLQAMGRVPDALLYVVGSGESAGTQDQTARLLRLTTELGLIKRTHFVGRADEQRKLDFYAAADVFVLPSSSEAQGIVALEAMACGLPVVASAVGGLPNTIRDGETGVLVPPGDVGALGKSLEDLLGDSARRERIGVAARKAVEASFAWQSAIEATVAVYREALGCQ